MGMKQTVFGSFRVLGDDLWKNAGTAADGLEIVYPYDLNRDDPSYLAFKQSFEQKFQAPPDAFASLAYDAMRILLDAVCRAGLNRGRIRDALYGLENFRGVTGEMRFDPNAKNIMPLYLGTVRGGKVEFRRYPMQMPYATVGDQALGYSGPPLPDLPAGDLRIALFGPQADQVAATLHAPLGYRLVGIPSDKAWGKSSSELVAALYDDRTAAIISLDRNASHLAEQIAAKAFVPLLALSSDRSLTSVNVPWIFRMDPTATPEQAVRCLVAAVARAGRNRELIRAQLASGSPLAGVRFDSHGETVR
jgi:ABC-type branched-subunit amino acid transport system substrate-binding protein